MLKLSSSFYCVPQIAGAEFYLIILITIIVKKKKTKIVFTRHTKTMVKNVKTINVNI